MSVVARGICREFLLALWLIVSPNNVMYKRALSKHMLRGLLQPGSPASSHMHSKQRLPEMDALFHQEALVEALAAAFPQGEGEGQGEGQGLRLSRGTRGRTLKLQRNAGMFVCARAFVRVGGGVRPLSFSVPKARLGASVRCISQVHTCGGAVCFPFVLPGG